MILLYTFPSSSEFIKLPGLGASPKSYIQALTENVAVLINHYYSLDFWCIFSIFKIIQQSYKSVYNWKFQVLWYIFQAKSEPA